MTKLEPYPVTDETEQRLSAAELGTRVHQRIETIMSGHWHIGGDKQLDDQIMAYAHGAALTEYTSYIGGKRRQCITEEIARREAIARAHAPKMGWETLDEPRLSRITGQISSLINEED